MVKYICTLVFTCEQEVVIFYCHERKLVVKTRREEESLLNVLSNFPSYQFHRQ